MVEEIGEWMPPGQREVFLIWAQGIEARLEVLEGKVEGEMLAAETPLPPVTSGLVPIKPL